MPIGWREFLVVQNEMLPNVNIVSEIKRKVRREVGTADYEREMGSESVRDALAVWSREIALNE